MKAEFLRPKFDGGRFTEHTLPLEVARDLAAYETLIVELAKRLYMAENPTRQRVPKGFDSDFHLHIESVVEGSTIPVLYNVAPRVLPLGEGAYPLFASARDLVSECVAAPPNKLPERFPRDLLTYFNQIGRSLRDDESLELSPKAILTQKRRRELVLASSNFYQREVELFGTIGEADWEKSTFRLRSPDGGQTVIPMSDTFHSKAREYGGRPRVGVTVRCVGSYNSWEKLEKVVTVESLDVQLHYQLAGRFEYLAGIEDGWFDGEGLKLDGDQLASIATEFIHSYPESLVLPSIVPTPEGNLLFEWNTSGNPSVDLELSSMRAEFHAFGADGDDIERDFSLTTQDEWATFFNFLNSIVEPITE